MTFVKSSDTKTPVVNSKGELEKMLRRYGAEAYSVTEDYVSGRAEVRFLIPDSAEKGAVRVPIRIPIEVQKVYHALYGAPPKRDEWKRGKWVKAGTYDAKQMQQAERVAWRNLVLWVDAQLSAATIGLQTATEAFYAHAVIGPQGQRAIDYLPEIIDPSRLLASGNTGEESHA